MYNLIVLTSIVLLSVDSTNALSCVHENEDILHENIDSLACGLNHIDNQTIRYCIIAEIYYKNAYIVIRGCDLNKICENNVTNTYS